MESEDPSHSCSEHSLWAEPWGPGENQDPGAASGETLSLEGDVSHEETCALAWNALSPDTPSVLLSVPSSLCFNVTSSRKPFSNTDSKLHPPPPPRPPCFIFLLSSYRYLTYPTICSLTCSCPLTGAYRVGILPVSVTDTLRT